MKKLNKTINLLVSLPLLMVLGLAGCGGGGGSEPSLTMVKLLDDADISQNTPCVIVEVNGGCVLSSSLFPAPGSAQKNVDVLTQAGVAVTGKKCGSFFFKDKDGNALSTVGGTPNFAVLVDIQASGLDKAKALGFYLFTDEDLKSFNAIFDCESRRL